MFSRTLTACAIIPTLIFGSALSTAIAASRGDDPRGGATSQRGDDHSQTTEQGPSFLPYDIDLISAKPTGDSGQGIYELLVDGETVTVELARDARKEAVSVYDEQGDLVVGYMASGRRVAIFDANGLVERGVAGQVDATVLADYGAPGALIVSPWWLMKALIALYELTNGVNSIGTFDTDDDDDPPALWWCIKAELSFDYDSDGTWSASFLLGWDC